MSIEILHAAASALITPDAPVERIATGFGFTEGPLWDPRDQSLLFSDIIGNRIHRYSDANGATVFREPSHMANGHTWDNQGRLLSCEHATSRVTRTEPNGAITVLASHFGGRELNSPNDIVVKSDGGVYFTDPIYGRRQSHGVKRDAELDHRSVYRIDPRGGDLQRLAVDLEQPNGLCFNQDESQLYVNDSPRKRIHVHRVLPDGTVEPGRLFADVPGDEPGVPDGMKIDLAGNVWCCGPGGIHVFDPAGQQLARIRFPETACNFAFGGPDYRTLYVTACTSLYRVPVLQAGRPQWISTTTA